MLIRYVPSELGTEKEMYLASPLTFPPLAGQVSLPRTQ